MKTFTKLALLAAILFATDAQAQYCMLPGRTPYSTLQPGIINFKLNTINRTSANVEDMSKVVVETGDSTTLVQGHTYTVTIVHTQDSINFAGDRNNIRVWIDYNNNKSYDDAGETVITDDLQHAGTYTKTFTVPSNAPLGTTMLRATAKMSIDAGHALPTSCDNPADPIGYHGEMEDYKVKIVPATAVNEIASGSNTFSVFPNPTSNEITVTFNEITKNPISINLYDVTGKLVGILLNEPHQSSATYKFNLTNYTPAAGIYLIKATSGNDVSYQKLVKTE